MHDKQVRRRRAILGLLVGVSLILLTAYFGESPSSPLHTVQRGVVEVLSPVQEGASSYQKWIYQYDDKGLKTKESCYNKQRELLGHVEYQYTYK